MTTFEKRFAWFGALTTLGSVMPVCAHETCDRQKGLSQHLVFSSYVKPVEISAISVNLLAPELFFLILAHPVYKM